MSKIKLTKGELKKQRDSLKQFQRYLPTLLLKKQQLQMKILEVRRSVDEKTAILGRMEGGFDAWIGVLGDPWLSGVDFKECVIPTAVETSMVNIAGASMPVLKSIKFPEVSYPLDKVPFWVDGAIVKLREYFAVVAEISILRKQLACLDKELRTTTQRVNLFEKIKIPESLNNIRRIRIYLGDQMANAVGISKVAKGKILAAASV